FKRSRVARLEGLAVKIYEPQGLVRSLYARRFGSEARRAWRLASAFHARGVGTPKPIGFLERWEGSRLAESYFVTEFVEGRTLHQELLRLLHQDPDLEKVLALLEPVAAAVRAMHDAGVQHGDMGNQNILVGGAVRFVDVSRARVRKVVSLRERAFDVSRLTLPSKLLRIFLRMYWRERWFAGEGPPREFLRSLRWRRLLFRLHTLARPLRHPVKWARRRRQRRPKYPKPRDLWLWDARSAQPVALLERHDRWLLHSPATLVRIAAATAVAVSPVMRRYRALLRECYKKPVAIEDRIGMTISPTPETWERERALLLGLGRVPVLARYYAHETAREWAFTTGALRELHGAGWKVSVAVVQDRRAVRDPARWDAFVHEVLGGLGGIAEWIEPAHAINRVKWGIWSLAEYERLLRPFEGLKGVMGPAVNDFEFPHAAAALRARRFDALSLHLYVDRRGAPENRQGAYSALDKFALARALSERGGCGGRVIVSEVNWFLKDQGYAHPFAPYSSPGLSHEWDVDEETYADYMLRYYLHAICSGMVERVYWWRLVARPFGLVDPEGWRARPAYHALREFLARFGKSTFVERPPSEEGVYLLRFREPDAVIGFSAAGEKRVEPAFAYDRALDALGDAGARPATLAGRPTYYLGAAPARGG
ncbi:MAG: lipopolysaccharide kinase InaA family protein, partial [Planctomycetota bacterium]